MEVVLIKGPNGTLIAADAQTQKFIDSLNPGEGVRCVLKRMRDIVKHRRFFKMLELGFDSWEPPPREFHGLPVAKNFERFRGDVTCAAGYYDAVYDIRGNVRLIPHSISFASMAEDSFRKLYAAVCGVLIERILHNYTRQDLDEVVERMMQFGAERH